MNTEDQAQGAAIDALSLDECFQLLASHSVGRVAVARGDEPPLVVPVNYVLDGKVVVFRSDPGTKLLRVREQPISFQVDDLEPFHHVGWSVLITGIAYEATPAEVEHLTLQPWAEGAKRHWIRVLPRTVSGRRLRLPEARPDSRGHL